MYDVRYIRGHDDNEEDLMLLLLLLGKKKSHKRYLSIIVLSDQHYTY